MTATIEFGITLPQLQSVEHLVAGWRAFEKERHPLSIDEAEAYQELCDCADDVDRACREIRRQGS